RSSPSSASEGSARGVAIAIELFFPVAAIALLVLDFMKRHRAGFSVAAGVAPLVATLAWVIANLAPVEQRGHDTSYSAMAALLFNVYTLLLGIELMVRGVRANSVVRANFVLLIIAGLALSRFFDSDLDFLTRGVGFIVVGAGF